MFVIAARALYIFTLEPLTSPAYMFKKILVANRGEIAVRVMRACREMDIKTVAVFSEADAEAMHTTFADEAVCVGAAASNESYLRADKIIEAAKLTGAEAIHPGYGFLSENAAFAEAVKEAGIVFIGPASGVIDLMGSKINARRVATEAGAPVVPGTIEPLASRDAALKVAREFGFPVMLKAAAGGGGKGMRLVEHEQDLASSFETAQAEALAAFNDASIYLEKAIVRPRHIEIQIFADNHGNCVHLGERECSIQRRHQKVIEEAPSPIDNADELREQMGAAATAIARQVGYTGAGTIEFLVSDETRAFYFLEMNTRLQVEHPVTEMVTGIDLVREQICVAAGEPLSFAQDDVVLRGHAIECRVYAEDPDNNFTPSPGLITFWNEPTGGGIRNDSGVRLNSEVTIYYDPMISKLAVWGRTRREAIERMRRALDEYIIGGIKTTLPFFREVMRDTQFLDAKLDTGFIAGFNERRAASDKTKHETPDEAASEPEAEMMRDIAAIVAVLASSSKKKVATNEAATNDDVSKPGRWKAQGRAALHGRL